MLCNKKDAKAHGAARLKDKQVSPRQQRFGGTFWRIIEHWRAVNDRYSGIY
jgi:hypothetical protein